MPNELAFNTVQAFDDIYGHRVGLINMDKDPIHVGAVEALPGASNLTMASEQDHPRQRPRLGPRVLAEGASRTRTDSTGIRWKIRCQFTSG